MNIQGNLTGCAACTDPNCIDCSNDYEKCERCDGETYLIRGNCSLTPPPAPPKIIQGLYNLIDNSDVECCTPLSVTV